MDERKSNEFRSDSQLLSMLEEVLKQSKGRRLRESNNPSDESKGIDYLKPIDWRNNLTDYTISNNVVKYGMSFQDGEKGDNVDIFTNKNKPVIENEFSNAANFNMPTVIKTNTQSPTKQVINKLLRKSESEKVSKSSNAKRTRGTNLSDILPEREGDVHTSVADNMSEDMASLCLSNGSGNSEPKPEIKLETRPRSGPVTGRPLLKQKSFKQKTNVIYPLRPSLFPNVPPYFNFALPTERVRKISKKIRETMNWKPSSTTPLLVSRIVTRTGFKLIKDDTSWISTWRHITGEQYKLLRENQKVNHFPGTFHLGRKDRLWINISRMQEMHGKDNFHFMPQTFVLPQQIKQLRTAWIEAGSRSRWIVKPPAAARGIGVSVVHRWSDVPKLEPVIVQRYISRPYLINDSKFDLRLYVLVTSFDPLRLYIHEEGLVRFASIKYSRSIKSLGEKFIHLTNYSVNRANSCYTSNDEENVYEGHKWSLKCLWSYFRETGIDEKRVWSSMIDVVIKTFISCDEPINRLVKIYARNRYSCYELLGFDIMLDKSLKPWLLEVNMAPSLHANSQLDVKVKTQLIKDTFNTVGFQIPDDVHITSAKHIENMKKAGIHPQNGLSLNKYLYRFNINREERMKQTRVYRGDNNYSFILKKLNPDDIRQLLLSEDELARCGRFIRIFPSESSSPYLQYFEKMRYYNLLLDAWEQRFADRREEGISYLQSLCKHNLHLQLSSSKEDVAGKNKSISGVGRLLPLNIGDGCFSEDDNDNPVKIKREKVEANRLKPLPSLLNSRNQGDLNSSRVIRPGASVI